MKIFLQLILWRTHNVYNITAATAVYTYSFEAKSSGNRGKELAMQIIIL